jgi:hypothetical protein
MTASRQADRRQHRTAHLGHRIPTIESARRVPNDGSSVGDLSDAADVGIADDVHQPERSLVGGHLDQRLNVDVTVFNQPAAPAAEGVYLRSDP